MFRAVIPLGALLLGMGIMLLGNGLFGTLAALRMTIEGFSPSTIGIVVACHSIGFAVACLTAERIIGAVGHIRVFAGFAATMAICCLCFPIVVEPFTWMGLRLVFGFASAAVFMVGESWLAGASPTDTKGKVFAIYMVVNKGCFGLGQLLLTLGEPSSDRLFMMTAALYALCLIPVALTRIRVPEGQETERLRFTDLYRLSPVGVAGAIAAGSINSALLGLGPVFATEIGFTVPQISFFMTAFLIGSLLLQIPIGRTSDRFDRRTVLLCVAVLTAAACVGMMLAAYEDLVVVLSLSALVGGLSATIYPIAATHANDLTREEQMVSMYAGLLLAFAIGASAGPIIASFAMQYFGAPALFGFAAAINVILGLFTLYRMTRRAADPDEMQTDFIGMPQTSLTTPKVVQLDPRIDETDEEDQEADWQQGAPW